MISTSEILNIQLYILKFYKNELICIVCETNLGASYYHYAIMVEKSVCAANISKQTIIVIEIFSIMVIFLKFSNIELISILCQANLGTSYYHYKIILKKSMCAANILKYTINRSEMFSIIRIREKLLLHFEFNKKLLSYLDVLRSYLWYREGESASSYFLYYQLTYKYVIQFQIIIFYKQLNIVQ